MNFIHRLKSNLVNLFCLSFLVYVIPVFAQYERFSNVKVLKIDRINHQVTEITLSYFDSLYKTPSNTIKIIDDDGFITLALASHYIQQSPYQTYVNSGFDLTISDKILNTKIPNWNQFKLLIQESTLKLESTYYNGQLKWPELAQKIDFELLYERAKELRESIQKMGTREMTYGEWQYFGFFIESNKEFIQYQVVDLDNNRTKNLKLFSSTPEKAEILEAIMLSFNHSNALSMAQVAGRGEDSLIIRKPINLLSELSTFGCLYSAK